MSRRGLIRGYDRELLRLVREGNAIARKVYPARRPEASGKILVDLDAAWEKVSKAMEKPLDGREKLLPRWRPRHPWMLSRHGKYDY